MLLDIACHTFSHSRLMTNASTIDHLPKLYSCTRAFLATRHQRCVIYIMPPDTFPVTSRVPLGCDLFLGIFVLLSSLTISLIASRPLFVVLPVTAKPTAQSSLFQMPFPSSRSLAVSVWCCNRRILSLFVSLSNLFVPLRTALTHTPSTAPFCRYPCFRNI